MNKVTLSDTSHRWLFSREFHLNKTASRRDGIDHEKECSLRRHAARFIQQLAERLNYNIKENRRKISQYCIGTAIVHMQRFYMIHSFKLFDYRDVGSACLFMAGKSEECPRKLEYVIRAYWAMRFPNYPTVPRKQLYDDVANNILLLESAVLETIAFELSVPLPHPFVLKHMQRLSTSEKVTEVAYFFASDVLSVTEWATRFNAKKIAVLCLYAICAWAGQEIPEYYDPEEDAELPAAGGEKRPWYDLMVPGLTLEEIKSVVNEFLDIYDSCRDMIKLARFVAKGTIKLAAFSSRLQPPPPLAPLPPPTMPTQKKKLDSSGPYLPPPPPPPTISVKKTDNKDYKPRDNSVSSKNDILKENSSPSESEVSQKHLANLFGGDSPTGNNGDVKRHKEKKHKEHKEHKKSKKEHKYHKRDDSDRERHRHRRDSEDHREHRKRAHDRDDNGAHREKRRMHSPSGARSPQPLSATPLTLQKPNHDLEDGEVL